MGLKFCIVWPYPVVHGFNGCCVNPIAGAVLHNRHSISGFFEKLTLNSTTATFNVPGHAFGPQSFSRVSDLLKAAQDKGTGRLPAADLCCSGCL